MDLFFLIVSAFVLLSSSSHRPILFCDAGDRLAAGQSISVNQTLVSAGQIFALGFFTPENSTANLQQYAGIWYNRLPGRRTVVWVANRENPLRDPTGVLAVTGDGNIAVLDGAGRTIWSTNLSGRMPSNTSAVLLDSGNLVLRHGGGDVWQSFDHPTDTLLPFMKLRSNLSSSADAGAAGSGLTSWKGTADPSPGEFVFTVDFKNSLQPCILRGSEIHFRWHVWDGKPVLTALGSLTSPVVASIVKDGDEIYWTYYMIDNSMLGRGVLDYRGTYTFSYWAETMKKWVVVMSFPTRPCDFYNRCGPAGVCDYTEDSCGCLDGFEPRSPAEWKVRNFTGGCVRRLRLRCDGTDWYAKLPLARLPDGYNVVWNKSMEQCESECSARCGCQAYAYADLRTLEGELSGSRCLFWVGEMKDLGRRVPVYGEDLSVRLHHSEPGNSTGSEDGVFGTSKNRGLIKIITPILSFAMLLIMGICCYFLSKRHKRREGKRKTRKMVLSRGLDFPTEAGSSEKEMPDVAMLDLQVVRAITSDFCSDNKLGEGGFGPVYKGRFLNGQEVAVKRLSKGSKQGYQEFHNEVTLIARLQHNNLVKLLGWCTHKEERILIYEYMPNKSLDRFVFDRTRSAELDWKKRLDIIKGIANGLIYLHQHSRMRVIHRDLKTSNILLDGEMNPKISDFGLARTFQTNQEKENTQRVVGTYGYMSPEYALNGVFSEKSDVFSFGVIMLEIITGKRSTGFYPDSNSQSLFGYAWQKWEGGRALELVDPSMGTSPSSDHEVLIRCTQLAMLCIQEDPADRPTMPSIVSLLSNDVCCPSPLPKRPAFVIGTSPNSSLPSSLHGAVKSSATNELTRSSVVGR